MKHFGDFQQAAENRFLQIANAGVAAAKA